jgi:hypothetical protein
MFDAGIVLRQFGVSDHRYRRAASDSIQLRRGILPPAPGEFTDD